MSSFAEKDIVNQIAKIIDNKTQIPPFSNERKIWCGEYSDGHGSSCLVMMIRTGKERTFTLVPMVEGNPVRDLPILSLSKPEIERICHVLEADWNTPAIDLREILKQAEPIAKDVYLQEAEKVIANGQVAD